jgi:hypothetical protein
MADEWYDKLVETPDNGKSNANAWNVPADTVNALDKAVAKAAKAISALNEKDTRTEVATAAANSAFDALTTLMRDIKRRHFFRPPLTDADFVALGLHLPDAVHTPAHAPTAEVTVDTFLTGRHQLGVSVNYITGSVNDPANKAYRVWYRVLAPGEAAPATPDDLHKTFFTKKRKDVITFDYADSGKTVWMAVQVENDGKTGPWGPMVSALIP